MANVYSIAFTVVGILLAHCCLLVWTVIVLPGPVERARRRIESRPIVSFIVGIICCLLTVAAIAAYMSVRAKVEPTLDNWLDYLAVHLQVTRIYNDSWIVTNALMWLLAVPILAAFVFGGAAISQLFAIRARAMMRDDRPLLGLTYGALCTSVAYFLPLVGWFVYLPIVGLISIGAGIWGMLTRSAARGGESRSNPGSRQASMRSSR